MIKIKNLTVKNFMSVGNQTQAVDFEKEQLTLVLGENLDQGGDDSGSRNGTGKTTIVNALSYSIFGQALTNIKKDNLINKINGKNMLVTINFEKNGISYRIERGRKPTILKFYINDHEQEIGDLDESQGDSRKTQEAIDDLFGMSHTMFKHILALNTYTEPFLSLKANEQREVIEQLLGITMLSEKAELLKEQVKLTKDSITQETANIEAIKNSNERIRATIDSLKLKQTAWNKKKDEELVKIQSAISHLESVDIDKELQDHEQLKLWLEKNESIKSLNKERASLESALIQAQKSVEKSQQDIQRTENHKCHACGQKLHDSKMEEMLSKLRIDLDEATGYQEEVSKKLDDVMEMLSSIGDLNK